MTNFNDTMTDIALALIDLASATDIETRDEICLDIHTAIGHLTESERDDLMPRLATAINKLTDTAPAKF